MTLTPDMVRAAIAANGISQKEFADRAKISQGLFSGWLNGKNGISDIVAMRIQRVMGMKDAKPKSSREEAAKDVEAAAAQIMDALGMPVTKAEPEPTPEPDPEPKTEPETETAPRSEPIPERRSIADVVYELMQFQGVEADDEHMLIDLHNAGGYELMTFLRDLIALKIMKTRKSLSAYAYDVASLSLLDNYGKGDANGSKDQ